MKEILYCPLCKKDLINYDSYFKCENNHSFDIARKGYVNLLLANQHHSDKSGDDKEMILSRVRFLNTGKYDLLKNGIFQVINTYILKDNLPQVSIVDVGCGDGYYTTFFHQKLNEKFNLEIKTYGVDLSKQAINQCSIRQRKLNLSNLQFVIGNMNYLPIKDQSVDFLINSFAKIDLKEFSRVIKKNGYFVRILPGERHLYGLKQVLYKNVRLNTEKEKELDGFNFVEEKRLSKVINLNNQEIVDLFMMTPYFYKSPSNSLDKLEKYENLETEIEFSILIYQKI